MLYICSVKRIFVFLLIPFFLLNGSLKELFKLPVVFTHFAEHQKMDQDLRLIDFISMHYWGDDMNENDEDRDMQLPFKKVDAPSSFQIVSFEEAMPICEKASVLHIPKTILPGFKEFTILNPSLDCLFRPPIA